MMVAVCSNVWGVCRVDFFGWIWYWLTGFRPMVQAQVEGLAQTHSKVPVSGPSSSVFPSVSSY